MYGEKYDNYWENFIYIPGSCTAPVSLIKTFSSLEISGGKKPIWAAEGRRKRKCYDSQEKDFQHPLPAQGIGREKQSPCSPTGREPQVWKTRRWKPRWWPSSHLSSGVFSSQVSKISAPPPLPISNTMGIRPWKSMGVGIITSSKSPSFSTLQRRQWQRSSHSLHPKRGLWALRRWGSRQTQPEVTSKSGVWITEREWKLWSWPKMLPW